MEAVEVGSQHLAMIEGGHHGSQIVFNAAQQFRDGGVGIANDALGIGHHHGTGHHIQGLTDAQVFSCRSRSLLEQRAHAFNGFVDEGLLAWQRVEGLVVIAVAKFGHHVHGHLLDRNVRADHVVDALRHGAEFTLEALRIDDHIDVASFMLGGHAVHLLDQLCNVLLHRRHGLSQHRQLVLALDLGRHVQSTPCQAIGSLQHLRRIFPNG